MASSLALQQYKSNVGFPEVKIRVEVKRLHSRLTGKKQRPGKRRRGLAPLGGETLRALRSQLLSSDQFGVGEGQITAVQAVKHSQICLCEDTGA